MYMKPRFLGVSVDIKLAMGSIHKETPNNLPKLTKQFKLCLNILLINLIYRNKNLIALFQNLLKVKETKD